MMRSGRRGSVRGLLPSLPEKLYIIDTVRGFPVKTKFKRIIYLPHELASGDHARKIRPAIRHHFEYRVMGADRKFRSHFRHGRTTLLIGLSFLTIALIARQMVSHLSNVLAAQLFADALLIIGWVAMWEPVTVLLYELWPIIRMKKVYQKISGMEIDILPGP